MTTATAAGTLLPIGDIRLLGGLVGIPTAVYFRLLGMGETGAVGVMRCLNQLRVPPPAAHGLALAIDLVVVAPVAFWPSFTIDIGDSVAARLGLDHPDDAALAAIVSGRGVQRPTANLYAPLVVNRRSGVGCQVVPTRPPSAGGYSVAEPLPVSEL